MMIRIKIILLIVIAAMLVRQYEGTSRPNPVNPVDPVATSADMLMLYDADNKAKLPDKGALIDSPTFRVWLKEHQVNSLIVPSITTFGDDQPKFKKLDEQKRDSDNWLYLDNGRIRGKLSQKLPENEDAAEKLIGGYVR